MPTEQAKARWKYALNSVRSNVRLDNTAIPSLGLTRPSYLLEKLDPKHRRALYLIPEYLLWQHSNSKKNFFEWLDDKESATGEKLPRMIYRTTREAQQKVLIEVNDHRLYCNHKLVDTRGFAGKRPGYAAYALSTDNKIYISTHNAANEVHASLLGGEKVCCAGMIKVKNGKITELNNFSGHYQPGLKSLLFTVKQMPRSTFTTDAKIMYLEQRFPVISNWLLTSHYKFLRYLGGIFSRSTISITMSVKEFIAFAEKKIEKTENKFLYKRDKKHNRYENTLYETYLSKTIIENDQTWRPTVLKINQWIYDKIIQDKTNQQMIGLLIKQLKKHVHNYIDENNVFTILRHFLIHTPNIKQTILFHDHYFEYVHKTIKNQKPYDALETYKQLRTEDLFSQENRGIHATSAWHRRLHRLKHYFKKSNEFGILLGHHTDELKNYFEGEPGPKRPAKHIYTSRDKRLPYRQTQQHREQKNQPAKPFGKEIIERDITIISGTSGTTSKTMPHLIESMHLTNDEIKTYLMVRAAALTAYGHHSIYETMVLARKLGFDINYHHQFYHEQFLTNAFKKSHAYKSFLDSYPNIVKNYLPKTPEKITQQHLAYLKIKKSLESKESKSSIPRLAKPLKNAIINFDKDNLRKTRVYFASLARCAILPKVHGYTVIGMPGTQVKRGFGKIYQARQLRTHAPYSVTPELVSAALRSRTLKQATKRALLSLNKTHFSSTELFLKELYTRIARIYGFNTHDTTTKERILMQISDSNNQELRELIHLNTDYNTTDIHILPGKTTGYGTRRDRDAFENDSASLSIKEQTHIHPDDVRDVYHQQILYRQYMEEKAGLGESTDTELRMKPAKSLCHVPVIFKPLPDEDNMFTANCNKVAVSILQAAADKTALREHRPARPVKSASMWSYGNSQRMFIWNPLQQSLRNKILKLINQKELGMFECELQKLAENAENILQIIKHLDIITKTQALRDILNPDKALGKIFRVKLWLTPNLDRGNLLAAREMLREIEDTQGLSNPISKAGWAKIAF